MRNIQDQYQLSYLFISHDLGVVKHMSDDIAIMHRGRFVEVGSKNEIFNNPQHIYTKRLLSAIPDINPRDREQHKALRKAVENEYIQSESQYYDENKRVFDLKPLTDTHLVALKPDEEGGDF